MTMEKILQEYQAQMIIILNIVFLSSWIIQKQTESHHTKAFRGI